MLEFAKRSATVLIIAFAYPVSAAVTLVLIWVGMRLSTGPSSSLPLSDLKAESPKDSSFSWASLASSRDYSSSSAQILSIWLMVRGVSSIVPACAPLPTSTRIMVGISGVLFIVAGIIFFNNPGSAALAVSSILGVLLLTFGGFTLGGGVWILRARREIHDLTK